MEVVLVVQGPDEQEEQWRLRYGPETEVLENVEVEGWRFVVVEDT